MVGKDEIIAGLREVGLCAGDVVLVHGSLSSFGEVDGGADTVVDAILEVIGAQGTLVAPTFNYEPGIFDPGATPSQCGAITEAVRKRPGALRSHHPTHSVAAIGGLADVITEGHENVHAFGRGSALFKVLQANGKILLLGVGHVVSSMIHVAEEVADVPYLDRARQMQVRDPRGKVVRRWIRRPGCSIGFEAVEEPLREQEAIKETMIGECLVRFMTARAVVNAAVDMLKYDVEALLCEQPDCSPCAEARAMVAATQAEAIDKEIIELAAEDERTLRMIEAKFQDGKVDYYSTEDDEPSLN